MGAQSRSDYFKIRILQTYSTLTVLYKAKQDFFM